jgi:hypothetical protein
VGDLAGRHRDRAGVLRHRWVVRGTVAAAVVALGAVTVAAWSARGQGATRDQAPALGPVGNAASDLPTPSSGAARAAASPLVAPGSNVLVVGDSLALDLDPGLADALPDRRVRVVAQVGRGTPAILGALRNYTRLAPLPPVLVVSAGTNDWPFDATLFRSQVDEVLALAGPGRCVLWTTVYRPPDVRSDDVAFNAVLAQAAQAAPTLRLVDWVGVATAHPDWLIGDGVHPTERGLRARVALVADAVHACSPAVTGAAPSPWPALTGDPWAGLGPAPGTGGVTGGGSARATTSSGTKASPSAPARTSSPTPTETSSPTPTASPTTVTSSPPPSPTPPPVSASPTTS